MDKTKYLVGVFIATALLTGGCSDEVENPVPNTTQSLAGQRLTDDNGVEYTLIDNGDGTETARYDDGRSVTFRRQEDGSLDFLSGTAGLLAGMAAGYFLFHGFNNPAGNWDASRNRYTVSEPLKRTNTPTNAANTSKPATNSTNAAGTAKPSATTSTPQNSAANANTNTNKVNLSKENAAPKSNVSSNSSAKSGFGTAGARGGSSSAAS